MLTLPLPLPLHTTSMSQIRYAGAVRERRDLRVSRPNARGVRCLARHEPTSKSSSAWVPAHHGGRPSSLTRA